MRRPTQDLRITGVRPLISPAILIEEIPLSESASNLVADTRQAIGQVIQGLDPRLVVVVGPCSIHDPGAALDYAQRLKVEADRYADSLIVVLRCYFEKPRTTVGWKGLINDPDLDGSFHVNRGLRLARRLLLDVNDMGLPTGSEFLDTQIPQYIDDLTSWAAIGARTTESQVHRELASGLSMPVGFKNSTDGNVQPAIDAAVVARVRALVPGRHQAGRVGDFSHHRQRHLPRHPARRIASGPNYEAPHVEDACARLAARGRYPRLMIDCSHGNSLKDHRRQPAVVRAICEQVSAGSTGGLRRDDREPPGRWAAGLRARHGALRPEHHRCLPVLRRHSAAARAAGARAAGARAGTGDRRRRSRLIGPSSRHFNDGALWRRAP
jgi:3-deoxy-7-phosphoheptulonate synthase